MPHIDDINDPVLAGMAIEDDARAAFAAESAMFRGWLPWEQQTKSTRDQYIRIATVIRQRYLDHLKLDDAKIEAMCRAHDQEEAAQKGEPDLWAIRDRGDWGGDDGDWEVFRQERLVAMRAALKDVGLSA